MSLNKSKNPLDNKQKEINAHKSEIEAINDILNAIKPIVIRYKEAYKLTRIYCIPIQQLDNYIQELEKKQKELKST